MTKWVWDCQTTEIHDAALTSRGSHGAQMSTAHHQVKHWRRDLHKWDPEVAEDEEVVEVSSTSFDTQTLLCVHS